MSYLLCVGCRQMTWQTRLWVECHRLLVHLDVFEKFYEGKKCEVYLSRCIHFHEWVHKAAVLWVVMFIDDGRLLLDAFGGIDLR